MALHAKIYLKLTLCHLQKHLSFVSHLQNARLKKWFVDLRGFFRRERNFSITHIKVKIIDMFVESEDLLLWVGIHT